ncbi:flagellar hook-associated protein FlgL [Marinobacter caseinilyticus]|uniref:flagellar hook-associated protein FlgL n=1 Tax=Marinobacter caseinilyticus TaxID=2692195 RepID=UPI00140CE75A|nr:flagellar hook-associated protein FlgL [Marinobacter caseinilyticus]
MVRISSQQVFQGGINRLQELNAGIQRTQQQLSSGKRVLNPADDPVAAARILKLDQEVSQIKQYQSNVNLAESRLEQEESTLADINDVIQRVRELTVQAGNGSLSSADRKSVAAEMRQRLDQLASLGNTRDASGEYIFSGFKGGTPAFGQNISGDWVYQGDEGHRSLEVDSGVKIAISDPGKGLFMDVPASEPTFFAAASTGNTSGARISTGMVLDQDIYNQFYSANNDDLVVDVNDDGAGGLEYELRFRSDDPAAVGYTPIATGPYQDGASIEVAGIQFEVTGAQAGDRFLIQTAEKQSVFGTVEKLIYGLENQSKTPAVATLPAASFSPQADDTLTINGVTFTGLTNLSDLRDAINASTDPALEKISAELGGADLNITSLAGDLVFQATDGGTPGGQMVVNGAKFQDLDLAAGVTSANVASGQTAFDNLIANSLINLDNASESQLKTQTAIGGRLNALESTRAFLEDSSLYAQDIRSELRDLDYAEAVSRLSFESFVLEAAQLSFAQVSRLSLFDQL